jgi:predicted DsbA family dithiol-disulfide isomerase
MHNGTTVEIFFDYICPWCYLGAVRTERLRKEFGVELLMRVFPLHPDTPEEGMELSELFAGREEYIEAMQTKLLHVAATEGLPLTNRSQLHSPERGCWKEPQK